MDQVHKDCIRRNLVMLCERLSPEPLHTHLMADGVFNDISMQYIKAPKIPFEQNQKLCLDLMKKGPTAFEAFVKCLFKSNQKDIGVRLLVCEHNFRNRANISCFQHLPEVIQQKYSNLSGQDHHERMVTSPARLPVNSAQVRSGYRSVITQEVGNTSNMEVSRVFPVSQRNIGDNAYSREKGRNKDDVYLMETSPRGLMLIINNRDFPRFPEKMRTRRGTDIDANKLKGMFINYGFDVERRDNLTAAEMCKAIDDFQSRSQWQRVGCCIVAILSHGKNVDGTELIFGTDGCHVTNDGTIALSWIFQQFNAAKCPELIDKPKWFIVQACRGKLHDQGHVVPDAEPTGAGSPPLSGATDMENATLHRLQALNLQAIDNVRKIPTEQDCLIAYATAPGYYSWRHTVRGSWFIQGLCEVIEQNVHDEDVLSILVKVNKKVASFSDNTNTKKQIPQPVFTLVKKWFLNPIPPYLVSTP